MRRREFLAAGAGMFRAERPWLRRCRVFADTLLTVGLDRSGSKQTPAWAGVVDTRDWSVPLGNVPAAPGIREGDRAVGGANLYHDSVTLRVFLALSDVTGETKYRRAANEYMGWFLDACQSPANGLLAWGEHLYYSFERDAVAVERKNHELLEWTAPWDLLWAVNEKAVRGAIDGLRYHHFEDKPGSLYNRHAWWEIAEFQKRRGGQPWIKHSGAYAHAFAFLYSKTHEQKWLEWARGDGAIYWERRDEKTDLTLSCIDDPRPGSKLASGGQALLGYWLRKAGALAPEEKEFGTRGRALVKAWEKYSYDPARAGWRTAANLDGSPSGQQLAAPWQFAYGESELLPYGRVAAYLAQIDRDPLMLDAAKRVARAAAGTQVPARASIEGLGMALNLMLDLHGLEPKGGWLKEAERYAGMTVERYWGGSEEKGLFVRMPGDAYYESKTGAGFLLAGLLRLDAAQQGKRLAGDWTL
ncbi:MAG: hypothetical protein HY821_22505 [Acidobacteria bacterium]|nr:hypothetical protein [Acidobacteriota bacterium]